MYFGDIKCSVPIRVATHQGDWAGTFGIAECDVRDRDIAVVGELEGVVQPVTFLGRCVGR